jgi:hypothetical protein
MRLVKRALDPASKLSPGVLFPPSAQEQARGRTPGPPGGRTSL